MIIIRIINRALNIREISKILHVVPEFILLAGNKTKYIEFQSNSLKKVNKLVACCQRQGG